MYFSQFQRLGSPRSRQEQMKCLMGTGFLVHSCLFAGSAHSRRGERALGCLSYKDAHLIHGGSPLRTEPPPKVPTSKYYQHMSLRGWCSNNHSTSLDPKIIREQLGLVTIVLIPIFVIMGISNCVL